MPGSAVVSPDDSAAACTEPLDPAAQGNWPPSEVILAQRGESCPIRSREPGAHWAPLAWSSDGRTLALTRFVPLTGPVGKDTPAPAPATLWLTDGDPAAGRLRELTMPPTFGGQPGYPDVATWSPDGRFLTIGVGPTDSCTSCRADGLPFYAVPIAGGVPLPLDGGVGPVSWASDRSFAVRSAPLGRFPFAHKYLVRTDTAAGAQTRLTDEANAADIAPAVSPDGKASAFVHGRTVAGTAKFLDSTLEVVRSRRLWLAGADGQNPHAVLNAGQDDLAEESPAWLPDGSGLVFVRWRPDDPSTAELLAAPAAGGEERLLATGLSSPLASVTSLGVSGRSLSDLFAVAPAPRLAGLGSGGPARDRTPALFVLAGRLLLLVATVIRNRLSAAGRAGQKHRQRLHQIPLSPFSPRRLVTHTIAMSERQRLRRTRMIRAEKGQNDAAQCLVEG